MSVESLLKRNNTRDTVVYWGISLSKRGDGTEQYDTPIEIGCTWKDDVRLIKDFWEKEVASRAHVYVDIDLNEKGLIYHGKLNELSDDEQSDPRKVKDAFEILRFMKTPGLGTRERYDRKVFL